MTTQQVETATVIGTVTGDGNATVTITSRDISGSPLAVSVAVLNGDTASDVAGKIRTMLAFNQYVASAFLVSGSSANVVLTRHVASANDSTLNIAIANGTCTGLTAAPTSTNTTAGDGLNHAYCALLDVRNVDVLNVTGATHDDLIVKVINGVSRNIDLFCGRRFYSATETRYYTAKDPYCLEVNDMAVDSEADVTLELDYNADNIFEYSLASTDFYIAGYNDVLDGYPATALQIAPTGQYTFPTGIRRGVKITTAFGWLSIPEPVVVACILQSNRIWSRFKTPLGQVGTSTVGTMSLSIPKLDPDIQDLLLPYRRLT